jgi:hypothetical protein
MSNRDKQQFIGGGIESIDDSVITNSQPVLLAALQTLMRKILQSPA